MHLDVLRQLYPVLVHRLFFRLLQEAARGWRVPPLLGVVYRYHFEEVVVMDLFLREKFLVEVNTLPFHAVVGFREVLREFLSFVA